MIIRGGADCSQALERNPFVVNAYQIRGISRIRQQNLSGGYSGLPQGLEDGSGEYQSVA